MSDLNIGPKNPGHFSRSQFLNNYKPDNTYNGKMHDFAVNNFPSNERFETKRDQLRHKLELRNKNAKDLKNKSESDQLDHVMKQILKKNALNGDKKAQVMLLAQGIPRHEKSLVNTIFNDLL